MPVMTTRRFTHPPSMAGLDRVQELYIGCGIATSRDVGG